MPFPVLTRRDESIYVAYEPIFSLGRPNFSTRVGHEVTIIEDASLMELTSETTAEQESELREPHQFIRRFKLSIKKEDNAELNHDDEPSDLEGDRDDTQLSATFASFKVESVELSNENRQLVAQQNLGSSHSRRRPDVAINHSLFATTSVGHAIASRVEELEKKFQSDTRKLETNNGYDTAMLNITDGPLSTAKFDGKRKGSDTSHTSSSTSSSASSFILQSSSQSQSDSTSDPGVSSSSSAAVSSISPRAVKKSRLQRSSEDESDSTSVKEENKESTSRKKKAPKKSTPRDCDSNSTSSDSDSGSSSGSESEAGDASLDASFNEIKENAQRKRRRVKIPNSSLAILSSWFDSHAYHPYPIDSEKRQLMFDANIDERQFVNWFTNTRKRFWYCHPTDPMKNRLSTVRVPRMNRLSKQVTKKIAEQIKKKQQTVNGHDSAAGTGSDTQKTKRGQKQQQEESI